MGPAAERSHGVSHTRVSHASCVYPSSPTRVSRAVLCSKPRVCAGPAKSFSSFPFLATPSPLCLRPSGTCNHLGLWHQAVGLSECLQRSVQTGKSSSQQVFWHSDFFFLRSLLHFFPHFLMFFEFFSHFLIVILHFLRSLRPLQLSSGADGGGGGGGGNGGGAAAKGWAVAEAREQGLPAQRWWEQRRSRS